MVDVTIFFMVMATLIGVVLLSSLVKRAGLRALILCGAFTCLVITAAFSLNILGQARDYEVMKHYNMVDDEVEISGLYYTASDDMLHAIVQEHGRHIYYRMSATSENLRKYGEYQELRAEHGQQFSQRFKVMMGTQGGAINIHKRPTPTNPLKDTQ